MAAIVMYVFVPDNEITHPIPRGSLLMARPEMSKSLIIFTGTPVVKVETLDRGTEYHWDNLSAEFEGKAKHFRDELLLFISHVYDHFGSSRDDGIVLWQEQYYSVNLSFFQVVSSL